MMSGKAVPFACCVATLLAIVPWAQAETASSGGEGECSRSGIGAAVIEADAPVTIHSVTIERATSGNVAVPYCLVKVSVPKAVNIWVGLPMEGHWNGRLRSLGSGGYGGHIDPPIESVLGGYVGVRSDTGHSTVLNNDGSIETQKEDFAMLAPGVPNKAQQVDFAYRSAHLMGVVGKQLTRAFYGRDPVHSYWSGCSEGGREGLRMAQEFPQDYDGILAGAPAIYLDRIAAYHIWPQLVTKELTSGSISSEKYELATSRAVAACDVVDGVADGVLTDPRECRYSAAADQHVTKVSCSPKDNSCLTQREAAAIDRMWRGAIDAKGEVLWPGVERGASLELLGGARPMATALYHPRFWVYQNPTWDWRTLTLKTFGQYFGDSRRVAGPVVGSDSPDVSEFRRRGGKIVAWHGFNDPGIVPRQTIQYFESVRHHFGESYADIAQFFRLFMAPGVAHCGGGAAPQPTSEALFSAVVDWVEKGRAPERIIASQPLSGGQVRTRPLCPYPAMAIYSGHGSTDDAANFVCDARKSTPTEKRSRPR
jgi:hypothetical protein